MYPELFAIAKDMGATCETCTEICCINMALTIQKEEIQKIAKKLNMPLDECRKKYTILMKNWLKASGAEWKAESKEGERLLRSNPRLLIFNEVPMSELPLTKEQCERHRVVKRNSSQNGEGSKKQKTEKEKDEKTITVCPFYDKTTRKCTIHDVRPDACRIYPFNPDGDIIDLRKVNACDISTAIVRSLRDTVRKLELNAEYLDDVLEKKQYHNHFYVPVRIFLLWAVKECSVRDIPLVSPDLISLQKMLEAYVEKNTFGV